MKKIIVLTIVVALALGVVGIVRNESKADGYKNKLVPPDGKTMLFIGQDDDETAEYINATGITPAGMMIYTNLGDLSSMAGSYQGSGSEQAGRMDFQDWVVRYPNTAMNLGIWASDRDMLLGIMNGDYDANIQKLTDYIVAANKPVYIRFGYEFDGPWNVYTPQLYVKSYQHFVDVVRDRAGYYANNIAFVWHSAAFFRLGEEHIWPNDLDIDVVRSYYYDSPIKLESWYPGDEYVDWVGISWFAWEHTYQKSMSRIRRDEVKDFARDHSKPLMIAEAAPKEIWQPINPSKLCNDNGRSCIIGETSNTSEGDSWDNWYSKVYKFIEDYDVKAFCYINQDWNKQKMWQLQGGWGNSRVQDDSEFLAKWKSKIAENRYLMSTEDLYNNIGFEATGGTTPDAQSTKKDETKTIKPNNDKSKSVRLKAPKIKKIKAKKKSLKVTWKKVKGVKGYKLQYSRKKSFKKAKTLVINKASKKSTTIKKLKSKKKYYIRVRSYKVVGKKTYQSAWSKVKYKKTK